MASDLKGTVPKRDGGGAAEIFGKLFEENWPKFFAIHRNQFDEFLVAEARLTPDQIEKLRSGGKMETLQKQWCAIQMSYYLFRYGGAMKVHYLRDDAEERGKVKQTDGPRVNPAELAGSRVGKLMEDLLAGRQYQTPECLGKFSTFGDCDETAFAIAQSIQILSRSGGLGLNARIEPVGMHAVTGVRGLTGLPGTFVVDPTRHSEDGRYPRRHTPITVSDRETLHGLSEVSSGQYGRAILGEWERYAKKEAPRLSAMVDKLSKSLLANDAGSNALKEGFRMVAGLPHEVLNLDREAKRLLWNEKNRLLADTRREAVEKLAALTPAHGEAGVSIAIVCVSTFFQDVKNAAQTLDAARQGMSMKRQLQLLQEIGRLAAETGPAEGWAGLLKNNQLQQIITAYRRMPPAKEVLTSF